MMRRVLLLALVCACLLAVSVSGDASASSQTLQVPHELHEHELTDHYGDGRDPRFDSGETDAHKARSDEGVPKHVPSAPTNYYPPPPPPAPPMPPSAKHAEAKAAAADAKKTEA